MTKALVLHQAGPPENFAWEDVDVGDPGAGEVRLRHTAIGFNSLDCEYRNGAIPLASTPAIIGGEGAGVVEALGDGVTSVAVGDRVAYALSRGAYAEMRIVPAEVLVPIPDGVSDHAAAALTTKGLTVYQLFRRAHALKSGQTILFHAAAGGVGLIACQWARHLGATLIGTVGSEEKTAAVLANGAAHAIVYTRDDVAARVAEISAGRGCDAVFDGVGKDTIEASLKSLATFGTLARFGDISGDVTTKLAELPVSTYLFKTSIMTLLRDPNDYRAAAKAVFDLAASGALDFSAAQTFALKDAAEAHRTLEARRNIGPIVLLP